MNDEIMRIAIEEAVRGSAAGEVPVGAVIVFEGSVVSSAHNENRSMKDPTCHAEMTAIRKAAAVLGNERLVGCDMYVTKEPCAMCAGAIVHARIKRLFIGATDEKYGACGTVINVCGNRVLNHVPEIIFGVLSGVAGELLKDFFRDKRK
ncbi:MAG: nucleoside deaminase [Spirochaetes bacterium]|jgi:tRNA(adenine34) deaminase|nr:nucleoside deaminase [Spirochaetota bacterium]